jgi:hypothetical protein
VFKSGTGRPDIAKKSEFPDPCSYNMDEVLTNFKKREEKKSYPVTQNNLAGFGSQEKRELALNRSSNCPFVDSTTTKNPAAGTYMKSEKLNQGSIEILKRDIAVKKTEKPKYARLNNSVIGIMQQTKKPDEVPGPGQYELGF